MWKENRIGQKNNRVESIVRERKVVDMRAWLEKKREVARTVLTFTPRGLTPNDHPPSVA